MTTKKPPIKSIEVTNIRGVKHVAMKVEQHLVVVGGMNGAGKSSLAVALKSATGGMRGIDNLLREGAQVGSCIIDLGNGRKIVRVVKRKRDGGESTSVDYFDENGQPEARTQERLNTLIRELTFDSMAFFAASPHDQDRMLLQSMGIDYEPLDAQIKEIEYERRAAGNKRDDADGALRKCPPEVNPPGEELSTADLSRKMVEAHRANGVNEQRRREIRLRSVQSDQMQSEYNSVKGSLARKMFDEEQLIAEIAKMNARLNNLRVDIVQTEEDIEKRKMEGRAFLTETARLEAEVALLKDADVSAIEAQIDDIERHNRERNAAIQRNVDRARWAEEKARYDAEWHEFDAQITAIHKQKRRMLDDAKFPVKGLELDERGIVLNGRKLELWNDAEKLIFTVALAHAQADPNLPLVVMDRFESLDPDNIEVVRRMSEESGVVTLGLRVASDETCNLILSDGQVVGAEQWADSVLNGPLEVPL